jgi:hypothetical protein
MADRTWGATDSGSVLDTLGNTVGTADGAGIFTLTDHVEVGWRTGAPGTTNDTLTIEDGITVKMASAKAFKINCDTTNSSFGTLDANGVNFTSAQGTPAPGDWTGFKFQFNNAASSPALFARCYLRNCTVQYADTCIESHVGAGLVAARAVAWNTVFRKFRTGAVHNAGGYGFDSSAVISGPAWHMYGCQFIVDVGDLTGTSPVVHSVTGGVPTLDTRVYVWMDHCSFLFSENNASDYVLIKIADTSGGRLKNCVLQGTNAGAGDTAMIWLENVGIALGNSNNFYNVDIVDHASAPITYSPASTDQAVDPDYADDTTYPFNLSPDAQAGDPDLYVADEDGTWPGAVEPYNFPAADEPDPAGTEGVWADRKQRVYECSFGDDANKTLGRAIRVGVSADDLSGTKLIGGIFLKVNPERLK